MTLKWGGGMGIPTRKGSEQQTWSLHDLTESSKDNNEASIWSPFVGTGAR